MRGFKQTKGPDHHNKTPPVEAVYSSTPSIIDFSAYHQSNPSFVRQVQTPIASISHWTSLVFLETSYMAEFLKALLHNTLFHSPFGFFLVFSLMFFISTCWYPKHEWKREKKREKITQQENFSTLHYALGKNTRQLRMVLAFWNVWGLQPLPKRKPNA